MGTGRYGAKHTSKLPGVNERKSNSNLRVRAKSAGYDFKSSDSTLRKYRKSLEHYIEGLEAFQKAMRETPDIILAAGGTISVQKLAYGTGGDANDSGDIRLNSLHINDLNNMNDTLPHEHTHNLVNSLITKELGYTKGSYEHTKAYIDSVIVHSINTEALEKYKNYMDRMYTKNLQEIQNKIIKNPKIKPLVNDTIKEIKADQAALKTLTIEQASKLSGMRDYAVRQYTWTPTGHYIEMPTVAAEQFIKSGHNFKTLLNNSPYSYFVLQELYSRIHKK